MADGTATLAPTPAPSSGDQFDRNAFLQSTGDGGDQFDRDAFIKQADQAASSFNRDEFIKQVDESHPELVTNGYLRGDTYLHPAQYAAAAAATFKDRTPQELLWKGAVDMWNALPQEWQHVTQAVSKASSDLWQQAHQAISTQIPPMTQEEMQKATSEVLGGAAEDMAPEAGVGTPIKELPASAYHLASDVTGMGAKATELTQPYPAGPIGQVAQGLAAQLPFGQLYAPEVGKKVSEAVGEQVPEEDKRAYEENLKNIDTTAAQIRRQASLEASAYQKFMGIDPNSVGAQIADNAIWFMAPGIGPEMDLGSALSNAIARSSRYTAARLGIPASYATSRVVAAAGAGALDAAARKYFGAGVAELVPSVFLGSELAKPGLSQLASDALHKAFTGVSEQNFRDGLRSVLANGADDWVDAMQRPLADSLNKARQEVLNLKSAGKNTTKAEADVADLERKLQMMRRYSRTYQTLGNIANYGANVAAHTGIGAEVGAAFGYGASPTGQEGQGMAGGALFGAGLGGLGGLVGSWQGIRNNRNAYGNMVFRNEGVKDFNPDWSDGVSPEWRDFVTRLNGFAKLSRGKQILVLRGQNFWDAARAQAQGWKEPAVPAQEPLPAGAPPLPPQPMPEAVAAQLPNGFVGKDGNLYLNGDRIETGVAAHEVRHISQFAGSMLSAAEPKLMDAFGAAYDSARGIPQPGERGFVLTPETRSSPESLRAERDAEIGRLVLSNTPLGLLYGGQRPGGALASWLARNLVYRFLPDKAMIDPTFNTPVTRKDLSQMKEMLFQEGALAQQNRFLRDPVPPSSKGGPPPPPPAPHPFDPFSPEERSVANDVLSIAATPQFKGTSMGNKITPENIAAAIHEAKQNGVTVNFQNIASRVMSGPTEAPPAPVTAPRVTEVPLPVPETAKTVPETAPTVSHPDYNAIRTQAEETMRQKLAGSKAKTVQRDIENAGIVAAAQAHAQAVGPNSKLITWRTDKYGKSTISGQMADPNDPFHQMLIQRANLPPEAIQNLNDLEANMGRAIAVDYSHAPEEGQAVTRAAREQERELATAPERVAGEAARAKLTKSYVPTAITYYPKANAFVVNGFSPDKFLNNANIVIDWAKGKGIKTYNGINDPLLVEHVQQLTDNHKNGFTGSGKPIKGTELTPVVQTAGYKPHVIPRDYLDQLNVMMGNDTARTGVKGLTPEQAEKQKLAKQNSPYFDPATGETNRFRESLGKEAAKLEPVYETLRPELIDGVRQEPVEDAQTLRPTGFTGDRAKLGLRGLPKQEFVAAGFMPATGKTGKIEWGEPETDVSERGREYPTGVESKDGRFSVDANFYDKDTPQDYTLHDTKSGANKTFDTFSEAKKAAQEWITNPPKPPETPEQLKAKDFSTNFKYRSLAQYRASRWGADVVQNPDGTFSIKARQQQRPSSTEIDGVKLMPSTAPTAVKFAALKTPDGEVHVDTWHPGAWSKMTAKYSNEQLSKWMNQFGDEHFIQDGFVLNNGNFVTRMEALDQAEKNGQLTAEQAAPMRQHKTGLEALTFREAQIEAGRRPRTPEAVEAERKAIDEFNRAGQRLMPATPTSPEFKRWFGDSKVTDEKGNPLVVFHGTTHDFTAFDPTRANVENDWGRAAYFSNNPEDVGRNYAGMGPDLTIRVERRAEFIHDQAMDLSPEEIVDRFGVTKRQANLIKSEPKYGSPKYDERRSLYLQLAKKEIAGTHGGAVMPAFLKMSNPLELGSSREPYWSLDYDEETGAESGDLVKLHSALQSAASGFEFADGQSAFDEAVNKVGYDGKASEYIDALRNSDGLSPATDEHGNLASTEILRQMVENMGYDGVIDRLVNKKFGSERKVGKAMEAMTPDTIHYAVFDPTQVKSATGNVGTFDPNNPDIRFMPATAGYDPNYKQPPPVSDDQLRAALTSNKVPFVGANRDLPAGTPISSRIDIPSFLRSGIYAQTVHAPKIGKNIGYDSIVHMDGPITFTVREGIAERIKNREQAKAPIAATEGKYNPDRTLPSDINDTSKWTPLGFDPLEHSYFYDKTNDAPVTGASEAIHIGNTVYVKDPVYGNPANFRYMPATIVSPEAHAILTDPTKELDLSKEEHFNAVDHVVPVKGSDNQFTSIDSSGKRRIGEMDPNLSFEPKLMLMPATRVRTPEGEEYYIPSNLLGSGIDPKTVKGEQFNVRTFIMYLAAHEQSGVANVCKFATKDCSGACLGKGGMGSFDDVKLARINKTKFWHYDPDAFMAQLDKEITREKAKAAAEGMKFAVRLNGTSDILWEKSGIMEKHPDVQFYDYTKYPQLLRKNLPPNYHLTYSYTGLKGSDAFSKTWHEKAGVNTAVVFGGGMPAEFLGRPVVDGDVSDLRFLDPKGVIVGLHAKGPALKLIGLSPFIQPTAPEDVAIPYFNPQNKARWVKKYGEEYINQLKDAAPKAGDLKWKRGNPFLGENPSSGETPVKGYKLGGIVPNKNPEQPTTDRGPAGVYLIRHGATTFNEQASKHSPDIIRGHADVPLDDHGKRQAAQLGKTLANKGIKTVFTSDLSRARDTGTPVAESNNAPLVQLYGLRPWDLGHKIQGQKTTDVRPQIEHLIDHPDERADGGESYNEFQNRFLTTMKGLVADNQHHTIAIVTHYRGTKLLGALGKDGEVDDSKFKQKAGALETGAYQFFEHPNNNKPIGGIKNNAV